MTISHALIWRHTRPPWVDPALERLLADRHIPQIFFRADDIAVTDAPCIRLLSLFRRHRTGLCLAVVPQWLHEERRLDLERISPEDPLWCWHQHGFCHQNHEKEGKKGEFGDCREIEAIRQDIAAGKTLLEERLGTLFCPVFTPPWNRCGTKAITVLRDLGFLALSRSRDAKPAVHDPMLPDLQVNVDLHTRKDSSVEAGWRSLMGELALAAHCGSMGIMLHHELMNEAAWSFLDRLLVMLRANGQAVSTFRQLTERPTAS